MKWFYYIPHVWESSEDRHVWEDVYLLPKNAPEGMESIWFTIDALGDVNNPLSGSDRAEFQRELLATLATDQWHIAGTDMLVRATDFSREELLNYVRIWLEASNLPCDELIESTYERFENTNEHATTLRSLREIIDQENGDAPDA